MKTRLILLCAALAATLPLHAETLVLTTAVHTKPDESSPVIGLFKAGETVVPLADSVATTPAGWLAVELPGPFEGYVQGKDLTKSLDVKPGTPIHQEPKLDSGVIAIADKNDKTSLTGVLRGKWTQIKLEKKLVAYIRVGGVPGYTPPIATATAGGAVAPPAPAPFVMPPANIGDASASSLPRQFSGLFVSTRRPFAPRRPYDWALNDGAGVRYAYLDMSKLLVTDPLEKFIDHVVVVFGSGKATENGRDIVIQVETLPLK